MNHEKKVRERETAENLLQDWGELGQGQQPLPGRELSTKC